MLCCVSSHHNILRSSFVLTPWGLSKIIAILNPFFGLIFWLFFTHLKLWIVVVSHNSKWVKKWNWRIQRVKISSLWELDTFLSNNFFSAFIMNKSLSRHSTPVTISNRRYHRSVTFQLKFFCCGRSLMEMKMPKGAMRDMYNPLPFWCMKYCIFLTVYNNKVYKAKQYV